MNEKKSIQITLLISFFFLITSIQAQVLIKLYQPPPNQLNVEHLWRLHIINNSGNEINVKLRGEVTEAREGLIFEAFSSNFKLAIGFTPFTAYNIDHIGPIDLSFTDSKYQNIIERTGSVPSGDYNVCIYIIDIETMQEIASDCIQQIVQKISTPQLIAPFDESDLREKFPVFTWLPPQPLSPQTFVNYTLRIVEVLNDQTPYEAFESNPAWLIAENIFGTSFTYPINARSLVNNQTYAWQVVAHAKNTITLESQIWTFIYKSDIHMITRKEAIDIIKKKIIIPEKLDHELLAYLVMNPVETGSTIYPHGFPERLVEIDVPTWFAWLDDNPYAQFTHETRFVFINAYTGEFRITNEVLNPILNDEMLWRKFKDQDFNTYLIFSTLPQHKKAMEQFYRRKRLKY